MELDARVGQRDLDVARHLVQQLAQLVHRLARDDHARHRAGAFRQRLLHPRQPVAVGGDRAQHARALAFGGVQVDAVEVVARLLGADGEARAVDQAAQHLRRQVEPMRQRARGHRGEILGRQHHEAGGIASRPQRKLRVAARMVELHLRPVGQLADDFVQGRGRRRAGTVARGAGRHVLDDGDLHVGGGQRQLAVAHGEHDVGQDRNGVAALHHALDVGQRLQQGGPVGLQLHGIHPQRAGLRCRPGESVRCTVAMARPCGEGRCAPQRLRMAPVAQDSSIRRSSSTSSAKAASRAISSPTRETGVHHRGVVAVAEPAADFGQAALGELLGQVHRHLARPRHRARAPGRRHVGQPDVEMLGDPLLDLLDRHPPVVRLQDVVQHLLRRSRA